MVIEPLVLLPIPRRLVVDGGQCPLPANGIIVLDCPSPQAVLASAATAAGRFQPASPRDHGNLCQHGSSGRSGRCLYEAGP